MRNTEDFLDFVRSAIVDYYEKQWGIAITEYDVNVSWFCNALQNYKAFATTTQGDGRLFKVVWSGDHDEGYIQSYIKMQSTVIKPSDLWGKEK